MSAFGLIRNSTVAVALNEWLALMEGEYVNEFVVDGGAAIKFVVSDEYVVETLKQQLRSQAEAHGLVFCGIESNKIKLHLIQDLFFAVSRQVYWTADVQRFVERLFESNGYPWPCPGQPVPLEDLADRNSVNAKILKKEFNQWLTKSIMHDIGMAQDFRIGITRLCLNRLVPADASADNETPIHDWLQGRLQKIGPLRAAEIYAKITRHNARAMLRSLCRWLRLAGHNGILLAIDIRQLTRAIPSGVAEVRFTPSAVMDAYEVLRQLIDDIDLFEGLFVVVMADRAFLSDDPKRSVSAYQALKMRIWDDVKARSRDNPLAPLVVLNAA
jgi:hypothetical protein